MARSKRFAQLDMSKEGQAPVNAADMPMMELTARALEASGTGVLHWENLRLPALPGKALKIPSHLTSMKLFNNALTMFPMDVLHLWRLETLELNANLLVLIPPEIVKLEKLRHLSLHHNHIQHLPPEIGGVSTLTLLNVHGNRLREVPLELSLCTELRELTVQDNPMHKPFVDIEELPLQDVMSALDTFRICQDRLELHMVPNNSNKLKATIIEQAHRLCSVLTSLYLPFNEIGTLPDLMGDFTVLKCLNLFQCNITTVAPKISSMHAVVHIDMRCNNLFGLPHDLGLVSLQTFLLDENCFEDFPKGILTCPAIEYLSLRNNYGENNLVHD